MYHEVAVRLTSFLIEKSKGNDREDKAILIYGAELLLSSAVNFIIVMAIGTWMGKLSETVIFMAFFCILREYAGGYHASKYWKCTLIFSGYYIILLYVNPELTITTQIITQVVCSGCVWVLAPVEDSNKPLGDKRRGRIRRKARVLLIIENSLWLGITALGILVKERDFIGYAFITIALLLVGGEIKNKKSQREGKQGIRF